MSSKGISSQWKRSAGLGLTERIVIPPALASPVSAITVAITTTAAVATTAIVAIPPKSSVHTAPIAFASVATGMDGMVGVGMVVPSTPVEGAILVETVGLLLAMWTPSITITSPARASRPPVKPIVPPSPTCGPTGPTTTRTGLPAVLRSLASSHGGLQGPALNQRSVGSYKVAHLLGVGRDLDWLGVYMGQTQHPPGISALIGQDDRHHVAGVASPCRTAGTVEEGLEVGWRVHLDHQVHPADIHTSGSHIGGHHDPDQTFRESLEVPVPLPLRKVAVQLGGGDAIVNQIPGQLLGLELGPGEQDSFALPCGQRADQVMLGGLRRLEDVVCHEIHMLGGGIHLVNLGILEEALDHGIHSMIQGGREEHALTARTHLGQNPLDSGQEAHVSHLIGLVQHSDLHVLQTEPVLAEQILQASRAGHHNLGPSPKGINLRTLTDPAVNSASPHAVGLSQGVENLVDLIGQLAGGSQNKTARAGQTACPGGASAAMVDPPSLVGSQSGHQRNAEGQGLAGTGPSPTQDVAASQSIRQGVPLDGECARLAVLT